MKQPVPAKKQDKAPAPQPKPAPEKKVVYPGGNNINRLFSSGGNR